MGRRDARKSWNTYKNLYNLYHEQNLSTGAIAKIYDTFPNTIRRALKSHGIKTRTKSQAQENYLETNDHPMLGRPRTVKERKKISEGIQNHWESLTDEENRERREQMAERARVKWEWMSAEEQAESIKKMHQANRQKAGLGSKNENGVANLIRELGYTVVQRTTEFSPRRAFEIDIAIPSERVAIEWDGAAHYEPIYGEDALKKTIEKDGRKNRALSNHGWRVIRCRDHSTSHSLAFCQRAVKKIIETMAEIGDEEVRNVDIF